MNLQTMLNCRDSVSITFGSGKVLDTVSRAILAEMRRQWLPSKPKVTKTNNETVHLLFEPEFQDKVIEYKYANQKIEAIKFVRSEYESRYHDKMGLLEYKLYVEDLWASGRLASWVGAGDERLKTFLKSIS